MISFSDAIEETSQKQLTRHLLLGNGFSIAYNKDIFSYAKLLESEKIYNDSKLKKIFEALTTNNFEKVVKSLKDANKILQIFSVNKELQCEINSKANTLKEILIEEISQKHPHNYSISEEKYSKTIDFLFNFIGLDNNRGGNIFTLNYDLLLYWTLFKKSINNKTLYFCDGFTWDDSNDLCWKKDIASNTYFLHGALHLSENSGYTYKEFYKNDKDLIQQIKHNLNNDNFPLIVFEGTSSEKLSQINHNSYLINAMYEFEKSMLDKNSALFIFGHSLEDSDNHIINLISNSNINHIYISVFGNIEDDNNESIRSKISEIKRIRKNKTAPSAANNPINIKAFSAQSANIW